MQKKNRSSFAVPLLFGIYLFLLIWIIVFKLSFSLDELYGVRSVNLLPFYYAYAAGERVHLSEIMNNVAIFVPFGIYLCMFRREPRFGAKLLILAGTSLSFELLQYALAIGRTDITDLITNTCGGLLGIAFYHLLAKLLRSRLRTNTVLTVLAALATCAVVGIVALLLFFNR